MNSEYQTPHPDPHIKSFATLSTYHFFSESRKRNANLGLHHWVPSVHFRKIDIAIKIDGVQFEKSQESVCNTAIFWHKR